MNKKKKKTRIKHRKNQHRIKNLLQASMLKAKPKKTITPIQMDEEIVAKPISKKTADKKKGLAKKPATKKAPTKKTAAKKKGPTKKPDTKKAPAKKTAANKKKPATKKAPPKKKSNQM